MNFLIKSWENSNGTEALLHNNILQIIVYEVSLIRTVMILLIQL